MRNGFVPSHNCIFISINKTRYNNAFFWPFPDYLQSWLYWMWKSFAYLLQSCSDLFWLCVSWLWNRLSPVLFIFLQLIPCVLLFQWCDSSAAVTLVYWERCYECHFSSRENKAWKICVICRSKEAKKNTRSLNLHVLGVLTIGIKA